MPAVKLPLPALMLAMSLVAACGSPTGPETREEQFDSLWETFDQTYPYFTYKQIDWDAARAKYRGAAVAASSMEGFALVVGQMLASLRDLHVYLESPGGTRRPTYVPSVGVNWNRSTWEGYIARNGWVQIDGWGWGLWGDVGYVAIGGWSDGGVSIADFDRALSLLRDARELIIDVRMNGGGNDALALAVAARFADRSRTTGFTQARNGPRHDDLSAPAPRTVAPRGPWQYTKPVTVLIGRAAYSSNESFIAAMGEFPHVTLVGDLSGGASANPRRIDMGEGWHYTVSTWIETTSSGHVIEWNGITPDIVVPWSPEALAGGVDETLDFAVARARSSTAATAGVPAR